MNKPLLLMMTALAAVLLPVAARADDSATLLAKHKAYVGWQFGDGKLASLELGGTVSQVKNTGSTVKDKLHEVRVNALYRRDFTDVKTGLLTADGFTGRLFWVCNENGFTRPLTGDGQRYRIARSVLFNEGTQELSGTERGAQSIEGQSYQVVRVNVPQGDSIDLYIDPNSGAYRRAVIDPGGTYATTFEILGYSNAASGLRVISKWKIKDSDSVFEYTAIKANENVEASTLHPPAQIARWSFSSDNRVPLTITEKRIYFHAKVNGVDGKFIFDTGADGIVLTQAFADRAKVQQIDSSSASGIGGSVRTHIDKVDTINVGGNVLSDVIVDSQRFGYLDADGLMGFDLLAGSVVSLDLDKSEMVFNDPLKTVVNKSTGILATVDLSDGQPKLPMKMDNIDVNAMMDTGTPSDVLYGSDMIYKYHLVSLKTQRIISGIGGYELGHCGNVSQISVGPAIYVHPIACQSPSFSGRDILIGFEFLKGFNYIFDYPEAQIIMIPRKQ